MKRYTWGLVHDSDKCHSAPSRWHLCRQHQAFRSLCWCRVRNVFTMPLCQVSQAVGGEGVCVDVCLCECVCLGGKGRGGRWGQSWGIYYAITDQWEEDRTEMSRVQRQIRTNQPLPLLQWLLPVDGHETRALNYHGRQALSPAQTVCVQGYSQSSVQRRSPVWEMSVYAIIAELEGYSLS